MITSEISIIIYFLVMNNHNFIYNGNQLLGFGHNQYGQLGLGDNNNRNLPTLVMTDTTIRQIACGSDHTFILKESGELFAFGCNCYGQLGLGDNENRNIPTLLTKDKTIRRIICGVFHSFILKESGELFAFGYNKSGELGLSDNNNRNIPTLLMQDKEIQNVVCGGYHSFIIKESGELFAFGYNSHGQLGLGDNEDRNTPTLLMQDKKIRQIVCERYCSFILKKSGKLFAFGYNIYGQLGLGDKRDRYIPTLLMKTGDDIIPSLNLPVRDKVKDNTIRQIVCGGYHSLILKESGELFVFGYNVYGQLGLGDNKKRITPKLLMKTGDDIVPSLNLPVRNKVKDNTIQHIVCGNDHTFILKESGELFAFGDNEYGQLGLGDNNNNNNRNTPTLLGTFDNIVSINGIIVKIKWNPDIYVTLSKTKKREIKDFLLVCHYYKLVYKINVVKYMRHMIISLLF